MELLDRSLQGTTGPRRPLGRAAYILHLALTLLLGSAAAHGEPERPDPSRMTGAGVMALQHQLTDASCYAGPVDGKASADLLKALNACPDPRPILRIETGIHSASRPTAAVDAQCRLAVTGATDKTVRLWSLPEGRLIRTQRLPIGLGVSGEIYSVAVSPDGALVAAGGADAAGEASNKHDVYLFDAANGRSFRRVGAFEAAIIGLTFSPDGRRIAAQLNEKKGLRIVDINTGQTIQKYNDVDDFAFGQDSSIFLSERNGPKGRIVKYDSNGTMIAAIDFTDEMEGSVLIAVSKDTIAYGSEGLGIFLVDSSNLRHKRKLDFDGNLHEILSMAWSSDGKRLFASWALAADYSIGVPNRYGFRTAPKFRLVDSGSDNDNTPLSIYYSENGKFIHDLKTAFGGLAKLFSCQNSIIFQTFDPRISFGKIDDNLVQKLFEVGSISPSAWWAANRRRGAEKESDIAIDDMSHDDVKRVIRSAPNGDSISFSSGGKLVFFNMKSCTISDTSPINVNLYKSEGWPNFCLQGGGLGKCEDKYYYDRIKLKPNNVREYFSQALRPDLQGVALATATSISASDDKRKIIWVRKDLPARVRGLDLALGGELILVAYTDGTIRWHRWSDGKELLALFVDKDAKAWVAWTPSGYYAASPGGEDMIGWHVNRGWEQPADFFPASKFRDQYSRPDVVERVLDTLDEVEAVKQANAAAGRQAETKPIAEILPPVVTILSSPAGGRFSGDSIDIAYELRSPSGLPIDDVIARVDGMAVQTRGLGRPDDPKKAGRNLTVPLPRKSSVVTLTARSGAITSVAARLDLVYDGATPAPLRQKPSLYALAIGVSDYVEPSIRLQLAAKDARDFASGLKTLEGGLYESVKVRSLLDRAVTRDRVVDGLEWLEKEMVQGDLAIIFLAGHGKTDSGLSFWFLPSDATPERLRSRGIPFDDFSRTLGRLAELGKVLVFIDACHSGRASTQIATRGGVDLNTTLDEFAKAGNGLTIFSSSMGREVSEELVSVGNGAFTKALLEGLFQGLAGRDQNGAVTPLKLQDYVTRRVKILTEGRQHPVWRPAADVPDFPIALPRP